MSTSTTDTQRQYEGYLQTPLLWKEKTVWELEQWEVPKSTNIPYPENKSAIKLRLGKHIEQLVFHQLKQAKEVEVLAQNLQVRQNKITLGEMDCILKHKEAPMHLEVIYKFYLYDESVGTTELDRWIGPNRKDSFVKKLTKLKEKQLPLLFHQQTAPELEKLNLHSSEIKQCVHFKAQLFVPMEKKEHAFPIINNHCIKGVYIRVSELNQWSKYQCYLPPKIDWLTQPHQEVDWKDMKEAKHKISEYIENQQAPLCWLKSGNGMLQKCFVVWW